MGSGSAIALWAIMFPPSYCMLHKPMSRKHIVLENLPTFETHSSIISSHFCSAQTLVEPLDTPNAVFLFPLVPARYISASKTYHALSQFIWIYVGIHDLRADTNHHVLEVCLLGGTFAPASGMVLATQPLAHHTTSLHDVIVFSRSIFPTSSTFVEVYLPIPLS